MPATERIVLEIICDNPQCPGNTLNPTDRTGWLFMTTEVYGEPTQSHVFCSSECASAVVATSSEG